MLMIYNLLFSLLFLLLLPFALCYLPFKPKLWGEVKERIGIFPKQVSNYIKSLKQEKKDLLWIHAASVGELMMAKTIIGELVNKYSNIGYLVSTNSSSGMKMAVQLFGAEKHILIPLDLPWMTKLLVSRIKPKVTILVEFEAWPNFVDNLSRIGSKIVLVNASMNKKIIKSYNYFPGLLTTTLNKLDFLGMQSEEEAEKVKALGVERSKIKITGNMKFDNYFKAKDKMGASELKDRLQIPRNAPILIAGSTHSGEEEMLFRIYPEIKKEIKDLLLIIAPRHLERTEEVKLLGESYNFKMVERTKFDTPGFRWSFADGIIILDTIGELADLYTIATIAFVGGSLVNIGCHNILEPVIHCKPVLFGPFIQNVTEFAELLIENQIGTMVNNEDELKNKILLLLQDENRRREIRGKAEELLAIEKGAVKRSIKIIQELLKE
jgi:3-deoxy-D-manno-octulosonic-acid transferase